MSRLHPHVAWRDGRPRFQPGRALRAAGHKGQDLRHPDGTWFSRGEAVDWSAAFVASLEAARLEARQAAGRARPKAKPPAGPAVYTVAAMVEEWRRSPRWREAGDGRGGRRLSPATRDNYRLKLAVLEADHPLVWNAPARLVTAAHMHGVYEAIWMSRGLPTARAVILALSSAYSWAIRAGRVKRERNPCLQLGMEVSPPRLRVATRREIEALVATADAVGRPEIGDMVLLGVWTGQRQADRLSLLAGQQADGRRLFRQAKTGAPVWIREAPELKARLAAAAGRRAGARARALLECGLGDRAAIEKRFAHVILDEAVDPRPGRGGEPRFLPFGRHHYAHVFAAVRAAAVAGVRAPGGRRWLVEPCPSLADLRDQDLRDTAVTWMALAGATIPEIISVTGHTAESATQVLKHYLARHPEMADTAIGKLIAWFDGGGEAELGL